MKKQTCNNNQFLANVKRLMNHKIYRETLHIVNAYSEEDAIIYLQQYFSVPIDFRFFEKGV